MNCKKKLSLIEDRAENSEIVRHYTAKLATQYMYGKPVNCKKTTTSVFIYVFTGRKVVVGSCTQVIGVGIFKTTKKLQICVSL